MRARRVDADRRPGEPVAWPSPRGRRRNRCCLSYRQERRHLGDRARVEIRRKKTPDVCTPAFSRQALRPRWRLEDAYMPRSEDGAKKWRGRRHALDPQLPVAANGKVYIIDEKGTVFVCGVGDEFKSQDEMGDAEAHARARHQRRPAFHPHDAGALLRRKVTRRSISRARTSRLGSLSSGVSRQADLPKTISRPPPLKAPEGAMVIRRFHREAGSWKQVPRIARRTARYLRAAAWPAERPERERCAFSAQRKGASFRPSASASAAWAAIG